MNASELKHAPEEIATYGTYKLQVMLVQSLRMLIIYRYDVVMTTIVLSKTEDDETNLFIIFLVILSASVLF